VADISIITAEDPRSENVNDIVDQIATGAFQSGSKESDINYDNTYYRSGQHYFFKIPERGEAISFAIQKIAKEGDTVVICGKGHEKSMAYNGIEYPWSDQEAVKTALKGKVSTIRRK
jgi:UDP-N-acetylmuramoyl-L-alanyl-D-glutamate--2,6-diaminopimelate ligase